MPYARVRQLDVHERRAARRERRERRSNALEHGRIDAFAEKRARHADAQARHVAAERVAQSGIGSGDDVESCGSKPPITAKHERRIRRRSSANGPI